MCCYILITGCSLFWFVLSLIADLLIVSSIVTPKWLIGPTLEVEHSSSSNVTAYRYASVGIYTRCKTMERIGYHCGPFDLDGFGTDSRVYPPEWKACMFFMSMGCVILALTVLLTMVTCCRQSIFGKSIHNLTACAQVISGICVMLGVFLHPLGWGAKRVIILCGSDSEAFNPGMCTIGFSFYSAIFGIILCFICAGISLKAEASNMRAHVKRRVEEGDRLVCVP
ncbi:LHFPL tetraspan subfamily member 2a protein [Condylostylus longicornis]|uniref:LHFPL tetraspan subfamily member 2a protein n=1 Tax=Condylostylus longicornis TaxID=2530218 RepID=UPI00244E5584|nr:LHFPL tetraspan subfamily member 2a protein [Condylostylus longicornis]